MTAPVAMHLGLGPITVGAEGGLKRYGDYFGAGLDPNGNNVWVTGEFVNSPNTWSTEITDLPVAPP